MQIKYVGPYSKEHEITPRHKYIPKYLGGLNIGVTPKLPETGHMGKDLLNYFKGNIMGKDLGGLTEEEYAYRMKNPSLMYDEPEYDVGEIVTPKLTVSKLQKYAGSINKAKQKIPEAIKKLETELAKKHIKKKVQTWEETENLSLRLMNDTEKQMRVLEKGKKGQGWTAVEAETARRTNINAISRLHELANSKIPDANKSIAFNSFVDDVLKPVSKGSSEMGRGLNIFKKELAYTRLGKNMADLGRDLKPHEWAEFKRINIDNPFEVKRFADKLKDPKLKDYLYEYWYNSILSGVPTHVVNVASNTLWGAFQVPHRALASGVDKLINAFRGGKRTRFLNETVPMMSGMKSGAKRGFPAAKDVFTKGELSEFETKWAQEIGSAQGAFERSPYPILRKAGKVLTIPTKALRGMDVLGNSIAYDAQIKALARRTSNLKKISKDVRKVAEEKFAKNPPEWAHREAMEFAQYSTFMSEPGKISQSIMHLREAVPGGRLVIPFVNTIGNLLKRGTEMTPGVGLFLAKGQNASEVVAKQIEGSILTFLVWNKMAKGEITGSAPEGKAQRERFYAQGKKDWSVKVGDSYYQYRRVEPFNTVVASAAISYEAFKKAQTEDEKTKIFMDAAGEFKNNLIDSSYLQGVSRILNRHGSMDKTIPQTASGFVPFSGFWRSINRALEVATEGSAKVRENKDWLSAVGQVIPGLSSKTPARLDVWGKEISLEGGMFRQWLPYRWSKETNDPLEKEFERLEIYPALPSQTVTIRGERKKLPDDLYRKYAISFGNEAYLKIKDEIGRESYQSLSDDRRKERLEKRIKKVRARKLSEVKKRYRQDGFDIKYQGSFD